MTARLREGVTVYQGAKKFEGEAPEGIEVSQDYLVEPSVTTTPAPAATKAPKQG